MGCFRTKKKSRERNFFQLAGSVNEIDSSDKMFEVLEGETEIIRDILYRPEALEGDRSKFRRQIRNKEFVNVSFTRTRIRFLDFYGCTFRECLFVGSIIEECEFHDCKFLDTNTHKIDFKGVYLNPDSFGECLFPESDQNIGTHLYQRLMNNSNDENQLSFGRSAAFEFNKWKRYQLVYDAKRQWRTNEKGKAIGLIFTACIRGIWGLLGAGVRLRRFLLSFIILILLLSIFNFFLRETIGLNEVRSFLDAVYFTVITLTTIGYGDITPGNSTGKVIMAIQGFAGFFLFALAASTIIRRIGP